MKKIYLLTVFVLTSFSMVYSHEIGSIKGRVINAENAEGLPGVNVVVWNTMLGVATDIKGGFEFRDIHAGDYSLIVSCIGFRTKKVFVKVKSDEISEVLI